MFIYFTYIFLSIFTYFALAGKGGVSEQINGKVVHLKDGIGSPLQHAKQAETIFARQRRGGGIQGVAEDTQYASS
jgi:hypothetical protein